jgi:uncharacterized protein (DUF305 family)
VSREPGIPLSRLIDLQEAPDTSRRPEPAPAPSEVEPPRDPGPPWWRRPVNVVALIITCSLVFGMVGFMVGQESVGVEHNEVDTGFLQDMRGHHEQAVAMSFIFLATEGTHPGLRTVARSIIFGQGIEIGRMIQMLRDLGEFEANMSGVAMNWMGMSSDVDDMPGMATDDANEVFVELMVEHHLGGIEMAEFAAERALSPEVRAMAASMAAAQTDEITEMRLLVP